MNTPYTPEQLHEVNVLEARHGFPGMIRVAADPAVAADLTPFQRDHALAWLRIANARFGEELRNQLGRLPTIDELIDRLTLSLKMHAHTARQDAEPRH
ncbi:hypothetical protein [Chromohalobacter japonicus]|uniref:hypothetical protein n=1 Tax=Chromohalobacter japonicus TaxID=223900 RepID=UPI001FF149EB|nr:hypothetical protein [Chromohalobacter japonicus]MCK0751746.1 hypothetical protein [Chromohalobacter japonicus]